jgi:predicted transcriptional regulator
LVTVKIKVTVGLEPDSLRRLRALSEATRVPWAVFVREALEEYLERRRAEIPSEDPDPRQVPMWGGE